DWWRKRMRIESKASRRERRRPAPRRPANVKPWAEVLEDRLLLATVTWNVDANGFWDVASNWGTGVVPGAGDDVVIDRGTANPIVTIRSGAQSVHSLTSNEALVISGGSLTEAAASAMNNGLTLSGGTLTPNGALTLGGNSSWSGGSIINGAGGV